MPLMCQPMPLPDLVGTIPEIQKILDLRVAT